MLVLMSQIGDTMASIDQGLHCSHRTLAQIQVDVMATTSGTQGAQLKELRLLLRKAAAHSDMLDSMLFRLLRIPVKLDVPKTTRQTEIAAESRTPFVLTLIQRL